MRHGSLRSQAPTAAADDLYATSGVHDGGVVVIQLHGMNGDEALLAGWCSEACPLRREGVPTDRRSLV